MSADLNTPPVSASALDAFVEVLGDADAGATRDDFYGRLCAVICRLGAMDRAVLFRYDDARRRVLAAGAHNLDLAIFAAENVNVETVPIARQALEADRVTDMSPPWSADVPEHFLPLLGDGRLYCIPLAAAGRWIGVVLCDRPGTVPLTDRESDLLWTLGKIVALAAVARIATFEGERARELQQRIDLARDVHDGVVQRLFGVSLALHAGGDFPPAERRRAAEEIQGALEDLRTVIQRPLGRTPRPTTDTLAEEVARAVAVNDDLPIEIDPAAAFELPERLEPLAQSVLVESLRNVRKHATPTRVTVGAGREGDAFFLEVANDGVRRETRATTGMGLRLAAFEALQVGGFIEFGQRDPGVWKVRLVVPIDDD